MGAVLFALLIVLNETESMLVKRYGKVHGAGGMLFNAVICLFASLFFIITDKNGLCFPKELLIFGGFSCLMFATGFYTMYAALRAGSFVLTKVIASFSGIIPILYGLLFLKEPGGIFTYMGIALVFISTVMMQYQGKNPADNKGVSAKWLILSLLTAISNGIISILQRSQQLYFDGAYDNDFMILSLSGSFLALLIIGCFTEKGNLKKTFRNGTLYGLGAGMLNGAKNFVTLALYTLIPISVIVPLRTGLGFIVTFLISVLIYKEKFTKRQLLSLVLGIVALLLFSK